MSEFTVGFSGVSVRWKFGIGFGWFTYRRLVCTDEQGATYGQWNVGPFVVKSCEEPRSSRWTASQPSLEHCHRKRIGINATVRVVRSVLHVAVLPFRWRLNVRSSRPKHFVFEIGPVVITVSS